MILLSSVREGLCYLSKAGLAAIATGFQPTAALAGSAVNAGIDTRVTKPTMSGNLRASQQTKVKLI